MKASQNINNKDSKLFLLFAILDRLHFHLHIQPGDGQDDLKKLIELLVLLELETIEVPYESVAVRK